MDHLETYVTYPGDIFDRLCAGCDESHLGTNCRKGKLASGDSLCRPFCTGDMSTENPYPVGKVTPCVKLGSLVSLALCTKFIALEYKSDPS